MFTHPDFIAGNVDTGFIGRHISALVPESYGRPRREEIALASVFFLMNLHGHSGWPGDPWNVSDNWRMGEPVTKPLLLVSRGEQIPVTAICLGNEFKIVFDHKEIDLAFRSYRDSVLTLAVGGTEIKAGLVTDGRDLTIFRKGRIVPVHLYVPGTEEDEGEGEGRILATMPGKIVSVLVKAGENVEKDQPLLVMEAMKMEMTIRAGCNGVIDELPVAVNDQVEDGALLVSIAEAEG